ncbi:hypothetical protein AQF52_1427 [Streptomyces venezuelae]|nr:hypothetical protein AQF52_1427 [Streptomyces venezuelae]
MAGEGAALAGPEAEDVLVDGRVGGGRAGDRHRDGYGHRDGRGCLRRHRCLARNRFFTMRFGLPVPTVAVGSRVQRGHARTNAFRTAGVTPERIRAAVRPVPGARLWSPGVYLTYRQLPSRKHPPTRNHPPIRRSAMSVNRHAEDRPVALDEYPVHQAPLSMKHHVSGDRNAYDRCIFHVFDHQGRALLIAGLGVYPNTGVIDAYATLRTGDRLHAVRASDALGDDRTNLSVGPLTITVDEPLKRLSLRCEADPDDPEGLSFDLTWTGDFPTVWEPHHTQRHGGRLTLEGRRFVQAGHCAGTIRAGGEEFTVTEGEWTGTRDRSWGVRPIPGEEPGRAAEFRPEGFHWLWIPMRFEDRFLMVIAQEDADGYRTLNEALLVRNGRRDTQLGWPRTDITYRPGTRHPERAVVHPRRPGREAPGDRRRDPHLLAPGRRRGIPARHRLAARHLAGPRLDRPARLRPLRPVRAPHGRLRSHRPRRALHPRRPHRLRHLRTRLLRPPRPQRLRRPHVNGRLRRLAWLPHPVPARPPATPRNSADGSPPGWTGTCPAPASPVSPCPGPTACPARPCSSTWSTPTPPCAAAPSGWPPTPPRTPSSPSTTWRGSTA